MTITAKFNGKCAKCHGPTRQGEEIAYIDKKAFHLSCKPEEQSELPDSEQLAIADKCGFRPSGDWNLLLLPGEANGDPAGRTSPATSGRDAIRELQETCSINDVRGEQEY